MKTTITYDSEDIKTLIRRDLSSKKKQAKTIDVPKDLSITLEITDVDTSSSYWQDR
jgi:hypothetical protein